MTTKRCPNPACGSTVLRLFPSQNRKQCHECLTSFDWHLSEGQKPLVGPSTDRYIETHRGKDDELHQ